MRLRPPLVSLLVLLAPLAGAPLYAQAPGVETYRTRPDSSYLLVTTSRVGLLSFLGHEHAILATRWTAELAFDPHRISSVRGSVVAPTRDLVIDTPEARALAGLGRGPSSGDVEQIQAKMLDADHLDAAGHPELRLDVLSATEERPGDLRLQGRLTLHGATRTVQFPARLDRRADGTLLVSGTLPVRQSRFGIRPESVGGVVRVADEVRIRFRLLLVPGGAQARDLDRRRLGGEAAAGTPDE